jgi:hypothetical protein
VLASRHVQRTHHTIGYITSPPEIGGLPQTDWLTHQSKRSQL